MLAHSARTPKEIRARPSIGSRYATIEPN